MKEQLVSLETAELAKKKGYKIDDLFVITNGIKKNIYKNPPTQSLLQKWLREIHGLHIDFHNDLNEDLAKIIYYISVSDVSGELVDIKPIFDNYEEALEAGLLAALNLI